MAAIPAREPGSTIDDAAKAETGKAMADGVRVSGRLVAAGP